MNESNTPQRSEALVYCVEGAFVTFLVVSSRKDPTRMVIPGGYIESGETPEQAARREAREEAGVRIEIKHRLGSLLRDKGDGKLCPTEVFLASMIEPCRPAESRIVKWVTLEDVERGRPYLRRAHRKFIQKAHTTLRHAMRPAHNDPAETPASSAGISK